MTFGESFNTFPIFTGVLHLGFKSAKSGQVHQVYILYILCICNVLMDVTFTDQQQFLNQYNCFTPAPTEALSINRLLILISLKWIKMESNDS